jgi:hypothetical protein
MMPQNRPSERINAEPNGLTRVESRREANENHPNIHPDLEPELTVVGLEFFATLEAAPGSVWASGRSR